MENNLRQTTIYLSENSILRIKKIIEKKAKKNIFKNYGLNLGIEEFLEELFKKVEEKKGEELLEKLIEYKSNKKKEKPYVCKIPISLRNKTIKYFLVFEEKIMKELDLNSKKNEQDYISMKKIYSSNKINFINCLSDQQ